MHSAELERLFDYADFIALFCNFDYRPLHIFNAETVSMSFKSRKHLKLRKPSQLSAKNSKRNVLTTPPGANHPTVTFLSQINSSANVCNFKKKIADEIRKKLDKFRSSP